MKKTTKSKKRNVIGHRVREARFSLKPSVSQDDLAGRMAAKGVQLDRTAISRIELHERYVMDYEAVALAKCLGDCEPNERPSQKYPTFFSLEKLSVTLNCTCDEMIAGF